MPRKPRRLPGRGPLDEVLHGSGSLYEARVRPLNWAEQRQRDEILIFGKAREPSLWDESLFGSFSDLMSRSFLGPDPEGDEARRHLWDLMRLKPRTRRQALRRLPYRRLPVAQALYAESGKAYPKHLESCLEMALLSEKIADELLADHPDEAAALLFRSRCLQANVRRLRREWRAADERFRAAHVVLNGTPSLGSWEQAYYYEDLATLREDQGRLREAAVLLWRAVSLCVEDGRHWKASQGLTRIGFILLKQNEPGSAMEVLTQALAFHDLPRCPGGPTAEIDLGRAICLAAVGLGELARSLLAETRPARRRIDSQEEKLRFEWLECRIDVHLGDLASAIPRLEAMRRWLLHDQRLPEVCLCSIDLALAYAKEERRRALERFPGLLEDVAKLPGAAEEVWALGSLWWFREAVRRRGRDLVAAASEAAAMVHYRELSLTKLRKLSKLR